MGYSYQTSSITQWGNVRRLDVAVGVVDVSCKSVCIGHNCELSEADVRKLLVENEIGTDVQIKQSECTYRIR